MFSVLARLLLKEKYPSSDQHISKKAFRVAPGKPFSFGACCNPAAGLLRRGYRRFAGQGAAQAGGCARMRRRFRAGIKFCMRPRFAAATGRARPCHGQGRGVFLEGMRRPAACHEKGLVNHLEANDLPSVGAMAVRAGGGATSPLAMAGVKPRHPLRNPYVPAKSGLAGTQGEASVTARRCRWRRFPCPWRSAGWCTCRCLFGHWRSWSGCRRP